MYNTLYKKIYTYIYYIFIHTPYRRYAFICYLATPGLFRKIPGPWPRHLGEAANGDDFEGVDGRYRETVVEGI